MMKKFKSALLALNLAIFFILSAIFITILISPWIHQLDVRRYQLDLFTGLSQEEIARNYASLANYLWIFHRAPLSLESFVMSSQGAIHFAEVKQLVDGLQVLWLITLVFGVIGSYFEMKKKDWQFLSRTAFLMWAIPSLIGIGAAVNFDSAFIVFHQIFFRNDYWIFDARLDPVINILPQEFFMHCFFMIVVLVILFALFIQWLYRYINNHS